MRIGIWTAAELRTLADLYPHIPACDVAKRLGRPLSSIYNAAFKAGLKKSAEFHASQLSGRIQRGQTDPRMTRTQFARGLTPWNKGKQGWKAGGRSAETRFKKGTLHGAALHNYVPIGTERICADGYLERKVTDEPRRRWVGVHRIVWEAVRGEIPPGRIVVFKPGMRTLVAAEITVDRLEVITRAESMRRNSYHRYGKDIARTIQLRGVLNRKINRGLKDAEQNGGSPQSPVRRNRADQR